MQGLFKFIALFVIIGLVWYCIALLNTLFNDHPSAIPEPFSLEIAQGDTVADIQQKLVDGRMLNPRFIWLFRVWGNVHHYDTGVKVGNVNIPYGASIVTMWEQLHNSSNRTITLRFLEGWNLRDIKQYLEEKGVKGDLYDVTGDPLDPTSAEGYLFPDTYEFFTNATVSDVVQKMRDTFNEKVTPEMRAEIKRQGYTLDEIVTIASILEIEVAGYENQRMVSDIIRRRINNGWLLQMDSTVNYIHENRRRSATLEELESTSPYNTYKFKGLPPGPISNPGLYSIQAALSPKSNNYWFFLHSPDGQIYYGRTFEEHQANRVHL